MAIKRYNVKFSLLPAMDLAVAPLVALLAYILFHLKGIGMVRDGAALWEGAVSLTLGHGYVYFTGHDVIAWPPLYSLYMALWIIPLGPTGWSLLLSNGFLIVLQAYLWSGLMRTLARDSGISMSAFPSFVLSLILGLFIAVNQRAVLSYNLLYAVLPLYIGVLWHCFYAKDAPVKSPGMVSMLGTALLLTHNIAFAFIMAGSLVMLMTQAKVKQSLMSTILTLGSTLGLTLCVPIVIWQAVRALCRQTGSHYVGLGAGKHEPMEYAYQLLDSPGRLLMFKLQIGSIDTAVAAALLLLLVVLLMCFNRRVTALHFSVFFVSVSLAGVYVLFNITWIYSGISSTYIFFAPLVLVPVAYMTAISLKLRFATFAAAVLTLIPQLYWTSMWTIGQYKSTLAELDFPKSFVTPESCISPTYQSGPPVKAPCGLLISSNTGEEPRGRRI